LAKKKKKKLVWCVALLGSCLDGPRDQLLHDLIGAAVNLLDATVHKGAGDGVLPHVPPAAVQLDTVVRDLVLRVSEPVLGHAGRLVVELALVMKHKAVVAES
jgi:hypothetical protein